MTEYSNQHDYLTHAKQRIDDLDAALASIETKPSKLKADTKANATQLTKCWFAILFSFPIMIGCKGELKPPDAAVMNVRAQAVSFASRPRTESLIGEFGAIVQSDMSFLIAGRIEKRIAEVGDHVAVGDVLAQINSLPQLADVAAAKAALRSAKAALDERNSNLARFEQLVPQKAASQQEYDDSKAAMLVSKGKVNICEGNLEAAETQLSYTLLKATVPGVVIARKAEVGQVVGPGQAVFTIAADGGRECVFEAFAVDFSDKPITDDIDLALQSDPSVKTVGVIREISPTIDNRNGTFRVNVTIPDPPPQMTLGSPVIGVAHFKPVEVIRLPWTSLARQGDQPSVWVLNPNTSTVSERNIVISSYDSGVVFVTGGLDSGELVVTSGAQMIRPGQKVTHVIQTPSSEGKS
jgi:membrane fusion protein, multidrug efflux system